ncbi:hypothetical protein ES703_68837 [subsurface metagenome]
MRTQNLVEIYQDDDTLRGYMLFVKSADKVMKYADACLRETGFSFIKYMVLHIIAANGGVMTPSEIADLTFRRRNDITTLVRRLGRDGFVVTGRNDRDKRFVDVTLTDKGRDMLPQLIPVVKGIADQVMLSVTEADALVLANLMGVLEQNADDGFLKERGIE